MEPDVALRTNYYTKGSRAFAGFDNPTLDAMIDKQSLEFDTTKRKALVKDILLWMDGNYPGLQAATFSFLIAQKKGMQGYKPQIGISDGYTYQYLWYA